MLRADVMIGADKRRSAASYNGELYAFVRGTEGKIYCNKRTGSNGSWSNWIEVPGGGSTTAGPVAAIYAGSLYLFVRGAPGEHPVFLLAMLLRSGHRRVLLLLGPGRHVGGPLK